MKIVAVILAIVIVVVVVWKRKWIVGRVPWLKNTKFAVWIVKH